MLTAATEVLFGSNALRLSASQTANHPDRRRHWAAADNTVSSLQVGADAPATKLAGDVRQVQG